MEKLGNLTIIGTSHISAESIKEVRNFINTEKPEIIALELDRERLLSLMSKRQRKAGFFQVGLKIYLLNWLGAYVERKLGEIVGVSPGSEMKTAIFLAKKYHLRIAVIDQPIMKTLKKLSKEITLKEKLRFVWELLFSPFRKRDPLLKKFDLKKVPADSVMQPLMNRVKKEYPSVYRVLVEERNGVMAKNLKALMQLNPNSSVLAIVGAGHEKGITALLKGH